MFELNPGYRLELHVLKSHGVGALNCDDSGRPKSAWVGGVNRLRISSQAEKFSIKKSNSLRQFFQKYEKEYSLSPMVRTRFAADVIKSSIIDKHFHNKKLPTKVQEELDKAVQSMVGLFSKNDRGEKTQMVAYSLAEINYLAKNMVQVKDNGEISFLDLKDALILEQKRRESIGTYCPEIQLFGRFSTAKYYLADVHTPLQVAQGITVHEVRLERDYFSAVDDLCSNDDKRSGSGHIGMKSFGAGVFYHYYCLDVPLFTANMCRAFDGLGQEGVTAMTHEMIQALLLAIVTRNPVGGQNSSANHDAPSALYCTFGSAFPYSAQVAFEKPVKRAPNGGYLEKAIARFNVWKSTRERRFGKIYCGESISWGLDAEVDVDLESIVSWVADQVKPVIKDVFQGKMDA